MQVAIISDLHANYPALLAVEKLLLKADKIVCLGDILGYYTYVNEVVDWLREKKVCCIRGNHDHYVLQGCPQNVNPAVAFGVHIAVRELRFDNRVWLKNLPLLRAEEINGRTIFLCHASPWNPLEQYLYADVEELAGLDAFNYDLLAFGHTHRAWLRKCQGRWILNPGSLGQSRDKLAKACLAFWDTTTNQVTVVEHEYKPEDVLKEAIQSGAGEWIYKHLR